MYTKVESRFWQDEKMRAISDDARYLMLYFLTSPHRNILGFYFLPSLYACFDLGWDEKRFQEGLQELLQTGRVKYDASAHVILIENYLKHNPLENPNQVKSAIEKLEEMPQTPLFEDFLEVVEQCNKPFIQPLVERLKELLRKPVAVAVTVTVTEINNTHAPNGASAGQDSKDRAVNDLLIEDVTLKDADVQSDSNPVGNLDEQRTEQKPRTPFKSLRQQEMFDTFWSEYPKRKAKGNAEKVWAKLCPNEQLFETIMNGLKRAKTSDDWLKENGRFIPYPASWLNFKGWEDEYENEYTVAMEASTDATRRGHIAEHSSKNTAPVRSRFAGLTRDGGTGHVTGGQNITMGGGNGPPPGNT